MINNFMIGAGTAAHQVEGNNIHSDYWLQEKLPYSSFVEPSGDCFDHYNQYQQDIKLLADAGLNSYRFSIEWARIEPEYGVFDDTEIAHYKKVLECCKENNIEPFVTLQHYTSPAWVISKGGWKNKEIVNWFSEYVKYVIQKLGSYLNYVTTINEINKGFELQELIKSMSRSAAYSKGSLKTGSKSDPNFKVKSIEEQLKAFKVSPDVGINGFVGVRTVEDEKLIMQVHNNATKVIKSIYPNIKVGASLGLSDYQGENQKYIDIVWKDIFEFYFKYLKNDDFIGIQTYTRKFCDENGTSLLTKDVELTQMGYEIYPQAVGNVLRKVATEYDGELIVSENGIATDDENLKCDFIKQAFKSVMDAKNDGVNVRGYFYWSLIDIFNWQLGFAKNFALINVDRETKKRYPNKALYSFKNFNIKE